MEPNQGYVQYQTTQQRSFSVTQTGQYGGQNWAQSQQEMWSNSGNIATPDNFVMNSGNAYGFDGNTETQGSTFSQGDSEFSASDLNNLEAVFYESYSQSQGTFPLDQGNGAYEYSMNFTDTTVPQLANPSKATAIVAPSTPAATAPTPAITGQNPKNDDPEYKTKREKNNKAARQSRLKKKQNYQELMAKCQRKKEKIQLLRSELAEEKKAKEKAIRERNILKAQIDLVHRKMQQQAADDDVQLIEPPMVAMPSGQGFGIERSQDFTVIPMGITRVNMTRRHVKM